MTSSALTGARAIAAAATAAATESPLLLAGTATGAAVVVGGLALVKAAQHRPEQAERLQQAVRDRIRHQLVLRVAASDNISNSWRKAVTEIWDALHWHLSPQLKGMPHVYTGSIWRTNARIKHHAALSALLRSDDSHEIPSSSAASSSSTQAPSEDTFVRLRIWGDVVFCFMLWLDYNPHTPNWGACTSYGLPPLHLCWHNRWREDLRHVVCDLARHVESEYVQAVLPRQELKCVECLLAMLDHVLSWEVVTLDRGSSELIQASLWNYADFCTKLKERFAEAWAATWAPPEAEVEALRSFETHAEAMAWRHIPEGFREIWSM